MKTEDIIDEASARQIMADAAKERLRLRILIDKAEEFIVNLAPYKVGQIVEVQDLRCVVKCWINHVGIHKKINGEPQDIYYSFGKLKRDGTKSGQRQRFVDRGDIIRVLN